MSTRQLVDETGVVTDHYTYDTFGGEVAKHGSTTNAFRYTGEQWDSASGFYYLRARWYAPTTGRFLTRDPFGRSSQDPMSLHKYLYANANPVNMRDPSGEFGFLNTLQVHAFRFGLRVVGVVRTVAPFLKFQLNRIAYWLLQNSLRIELALLGLDIGFALTDAALAELRRLGCQAQQ